MDALSAELANEASRWLSGGLHTEEDCIDSTKGPMASGAAAITSLRNDGDTEIKPRLESACTNSFLNDSFSVFIFLFFDIVSCSCPFLICKLRAVTRQTGKHEKGFPECM